MSPARLFLALAVAIFTLDVPELLHAMEDHTVAADVGHDHGHGAPSGQSEGPVHFSCIGCVSVILPAVAEPVPHPLACRIVNERSTDFVPSPPPASIFHPPA